MLGLVVVAFLVRRLIQTRGLDQRGLHDGAQQHLLALAARLSAEATDTDNNRVRAVLAYLRSGSD